METWEGIEPSSAGLQPTYRPSNRVMCLLLLIVLQQRCFVSEAAPVGPPWFSLLACFQAVTAADAGLSAPVLGITAAAHAGSLHARSASILLDGCLPRPHVALGPAPIRSTQCVCCGAWPRCCSILLDRSTCVACTRDSQLVDPWVVLACGETW